MQLALRDMLKKALPRSAFPDLERETGDFTVADVHSGYCFKFLIVRSVK
jgi:hypothetical protein